jgi:hypothetical protein
MQPKTVEVHLQNGNPHGILKAEMFGRKVGAVLIPRPFVKSAKSVDSLQKCGVVILIGHIESLDSPSIRIDSAHNCMEKIHAHAGRDGEWQKVVALIPVVDNFTMEYANHLKRRCFQRIKEVASAHVEMIEPHQKSDVPDQVSAEVEDNFESVVTLLQILNPRCDL